MQSSHAAAVVSVAFDEPNLIADAGLVPVVRPAERARLPHLADIAIRIKGADNSGGANPAAKVMSLVAAMCAGADSIEDSDRLRHGAMPVWFEGIRAPSTLGTFLRSFSHGHALQLHAVHRKFLRELTAHTPLLPDAGHASPSPAWPQPLRLGEDERQPAPITALPPGPATSLLHVRPDEHPLRPQLAVLLRPETTRGKRHIQAVLALARRRVNVLWALIRDCRIYAVVPPQNVLT